MTIWRLARAALTVPLLFGGLVLVTAKPAAACTCYSLSEADWVARADAVFVGTLVSRVTQIDYQARALMVSSDPAEQLRGLMSDSTRTVWTFEVSRVYKGAVRQRQEIVAPPGAPGGGTCSGVGQLQEPSTEPFLVFAYTSGGHRYRLQPGQYASNGCTGSRPLVDGGEPATGGLRARKPSGPDRPWSLTRDWLPAGAPSGAEGSPSTAKASSNRPPANSGGLVATGTTRSDAQPTATVSAVAPARPAKRGSVSTSARSDAVLGLPVQPASPRSQVAPHDRLLITGEHVIKGATAEQAPPSQVVADQRLSSLLRGTYRF